MSYEFKQCSSFDETLQKEPQNSPKDRISLLPDGIVGDILSCLCTKDAMKTSVLSRTWQYKWTSIYNFDISDHMSKMPSFINQMTRLLVRTCNSRIKSFNLTCEQRYDPSFLETWISCVLQRNVEILLIIAGQVERLDSTWCFQNWSSLKTLELGLNCTLVLPSDNILPNLRRLILFGAGRGSIKIKPWQISSEGRVILLFPALEYLYLKCEWLDLNFVEIHAPELIMLRSRCVNEFKTYEIKIFAPKLAKVSLLNGSMNNFDLHGCLAVSSAELVFPHVDETFLRRARKILNQLPSIESLLLSGNLIKVLVPSKSGLVFPHFNRLKKLHLPFLSHVQDVVELLQLLPPVESLHLDALKVVNHETEQPWPPNIVSNLKKFELTNYGGYPVQLNFSKFILENARNLEEMSFFFGFMYNTNKMMASASDHLLKQLMPLKSSSCVIKVSRLS